MPNTGYHFVDWSDGVLTAARTDLNVTANITVTANFAIDTFTLTYTAGAGGTIEGTSPQTVNYGADGTLVTAVPNTGYHFVDWSDGVLTAARTDLDVTANLSVTANFAIDTFTLTYTAGAGGTIEGTSPQTVNYGADGSLVTAVPNVGYHFVDWSDGVLTATRTDTNVTANLSVTANFALDTYALTITRAGSGTGTISSSPSGIDCGAVCSGSFDHGTIVLLTATPSASSSFTGWSGDYTGTENPLQITMDGPKTLQATFATLTYTISGTVTAGGSPLSGVTMAGLPGSPVTDGSGAYSATVDYGSSFTVTPTHSYYTFDPASQTYTNVTANIIDQNYDASLIVTSQRQALIAFYNSTNGDSWYNNSGWKTAPLYPDGFAMPGTEGTWYGLTATSGTVTRIQLGSNHLTGTIPPELGGLSSLQFLELNANQLTGTIPPELGNLTNLQYLHLASNQLTGIIPPELGGLTNLLGILLHVNQLTGTIPPELGSLVNLQYLYVSENQLTGTIPIELGGLINVQELMLHFNQLTGTIPPELGNLTDLRQLALAGNELTGSIPIELGNLTSMQRLFLYDNHLSGPIPSQLGNMTSLNWLWLYSNQLSGPIPTSLANLTSLDPANTNIGYNALYSTDSALTTFLNSKDPDWASTQTIAPASVTATSLDNAVIMVSWLPVTYTADAGLTNVYMSQTEGGPYTLAGSTSDKATTSLNVTGLTPAQRYYFIARTQTNAHANNANIVESGDSNEATAVAWTQLNVQITGTVTGRRRAPPGRRHERAHRESGDRCFRHLHWSGSRRLERHRDAHARGLHLHARLHSLHERHGRSDRSELLSDTPDLHHLRHGDRRRIRPHGRDHGRAARNARHGCLRLLRRDGELRMGRDSDPDLRGLFVRAVDAGLFQRG